MTRLESLWWCGRYQRTQGIESDDEWREHFLTLGSSTLCDIDKLQGGRAFRSRGNLLQYPVEARDGVMSTLRYLEGSIAPWFQALSDDVLHVAEIHNHFYEGIAGF